MPRITRPLVRSALVAALAIALGPAGGCSSAPAATDSRSATRAYAFWPPFPAEPRIQFLAAYASSEDVQPTQTSGLERLVFGKQMAPDAVIEKPYGVAMRDGKIYVADMRGPALTVLDLKKKQTRLVGVGGMNRLEHPVAVAVADDGMIYVGDNGRGAIFVYDQSERYTKIIGFEKFKPASVAVHGDRLYAADVAGQNVVVFDRRDGKRLATIGTVGDGDGQFRVPIGVSTDKAGNVYVMDMMQCRLQKFSPDGTFISAMGSLGDYAGTFARPKHVAVDGEGLIYVVDAAFQNVQLFDDQFRLLMHFGAAGGFPGAMDLPAGVAVSDEGLELFRDQLHPGFEAKRLVVVTNQFGPTRVAVYALGTRRPEFSNEDLAAVTVSMPTGVGKPSEEQLKMQNPGGEEPPPPDEPTPGAEGPEPPKPAVPEKPKPSRPD